MPKQKIISMDMIQRIGFQTGLYQYQVRQVLMATAQLIINDLALGNTVHFMSVGKFYLKKRPSSPHFNPYYRKIMTLEEGYLPKFQFGRRAYDFIKEHATRNLKRRYDS